MRVSEIKNHELEMDALQLLDRRAVSYDNWIRGDAADADHAVHPLGFKVYLPPHILAKDEYVSGDPYLVDENLDSPFNRARIDGVLKMISQAVEGKSKPRILDLGCGQGQLTIRLSKLLDATLVGLDFSLTAIEQAAKRAPHLNWVVADALSPPFADGEFDFILCANLWEHVESPLGLLKEARRILRPGGGIVFSTPSRYRYGNLLRVLRGHGVAFMSEQHVTEYSVGQVIELAHWAGFDIVDKVAPKVNAYYLRPHGRALAALVESTLQITGSHHTVEPMVLFRANSRINTAK